jgi:hypothetical protein
VTHAYPVKRAPHFHWVLCALILACLIALWSMTGSPVEFAVNTVLTYLGAWTIRFLLHPGRRKTVFLQFLLATVAVVCTVGLFEVFTVTRLLDYRLVFATPILAPVQNPRFRIDPELIYLRRGPGHEKGTAVGGDFYYLFELPSPHVYQFDLHYDRNGFRNPDSLTSAELAMVGDSFVENDFVADEDLVTTLLARQQHAQVALLGLIGYGPQQELGVVRRFAQPLHPSTVIWMFFEGNDLKNAVQYEAIMKDWEKTSQSYHNFLSRSFSRNAFLAITRLFGNPRPSGLPRSGILQKPDGEETRMYFLYPMLPLTGEELHGLELTIQTLRAAQQMCRAENTDLVVIFIPTNFRVYHSVMRFDPVSEAAQWSINDLPERFRAQAQGISPDIGYLDLTPEFIAAAQKGEILYNPDDSHWNAAGNHLAANLIDAYLKQRKLQATHDGQQRARTQMR